jgi:hypothetical protein
MYHVLMIGLMAALFALRRMTYWKKKVSSAA